MEKDDFWRSEKGHFITMKCFQHEVDYYWKVIVCYYILWVDSVLTACFSSAQSLSTHVQKKKSDSSQLPLKGSIAKP